jgi:hypothetical protein
MSRIEGNTGWLAVPDLDLAGYELVWLPEVFAEELSAVRCSTNWVS